MATVDLRDGDGGQAPSSARGFDYKLHKVIDFKETPRAAADLLQLFNIPAGAIGREAVIDVERAEGGTLTLDLGDYLEADDTAIDADGWLDGVNGNALATVRSTPALVEGAPNTVAPAHALGKVYPADSWIGLLVNNAADLARVHVTLDVWFPRMFRSII